MRLGIVLACAILLMSSAKTREVPPLACAPVEGVEQILSTSGVFIGDMHGSMESPAFLSALLRIQAACLAIIFRLWR
jgi:hypothetical protein